MPAPGSPLHDPFHEVPRVGITPWIEKWLIVLLLCNLLLGVVFIFYGSTNARKAAREAESSHALLCDLARTVPTMAATVERHCS